VNGPTALIKSVTSLDMVHAPGTLVVNIRFVRRLFKDPVAREKVKSLVRSYFALGGLQMQINVVDQAVLREAIQCPEKHRDLIVRIGGYSEYFHRLSPDLQLSVLQRTEHE
jgi:formate C-acetyltransferase